MGQPTAENPKGWEPLILKESQKEVDPLFYEKRAKNTDLGWKGQKECDKISCRRITYKELKLDSVAELSLSDASSLAGRRITYKELKQVQSAQVSFQAPHRVEELPIRN